MTYVLNKAIKVDQGLKRKILFSIKKVRKIAIIQCWKTRLVQAHRYVDIKILEKRKRMAEMQYNDNVTKKQIK